jgi:signal transduction histidine kinase
MVGNMVYHLLWSLVWLVRVLFDTSNILQILILFFIWNEIFIQPGLAVYRLVARRIGILPIWTRFAMLTAVMLELTIFVIHFGRASYQLNSTCLYALGHTLVMLLCCVTTTEMLLWRREVRWEDCQYNQKMMLTRGPGWQIATTCRAQHSRDTRQGHFIHPTALDRGGHSAVLASRTVVFCHYEPARADQPRQSRKCRRSLLQFTSLQCRVHAVGVKGVDESVC